MTSLLNESGTRKLGMTTNKNAKNNITNSKRAGGVTSNNRKSNIKILLFNRRLYERRRN